MVKDGYQAAHRLWPTKEAWMARKSVRDKFSPWTKEDIRELWEHSRRKPPVKKIAKVMKRTTGALRIKADRLGQPLGHRR